MQQLLWIETLLKASGGLVLLAAPLLAIRVFGLPQSDTPFWPRLLGAVLLGLAAATFTEAKGGSGLGLRGAAFVNIAGATTIFLMTGMERMPALSARGRSALFLLVAVLTLLAVFELLIG